MKKTLTVIGIVILILTIAFYLRFPRVTNQILNQTAPVQKINVSARIYLWEGVKILDFENQSLIKGSTAFDLLRLVADVKTKGEGVNAYIIKIDGRRADGTKKEFWSFYVNGKMAEVGVGSYTLRQGDKIEWKVETYR